MTEKDDEETGAAGDEPAEGEAGQDREEGADEADQDRAEDRGPSPAGQEAASSWTQRRVVGLLVIVGAVGLVALIVARWSGGDGQPQPAGSATTATAPPSASAVPAASQEPDEEVFGARHVLVQYEGSRRAPPKLKRSKEAAKKRAEEVAEKAAALANEHQGLDELGEAFGELVKEYTDEPGAGERGGDLGRIRRGAMVPQFIDAVAALNKGEVSGVVETHFGFHVIMRTF